jgi:hypothetical protein
MRIWRLVVRAREWRRGSRVSEESVGSIAELYLGNLLYALELAAIGLDEQGKSADASFYRGIARKLAEARGREVGGRA